MPETTIQKLRKWLYYYLVASVAFFVLDLSIYTLKTLFWNLKISIIDILILSVKYGLLMPLLVGGLWMLFATVSKTANFISARLHKPKPLLPEKKFTVTVTEESILVRDPDGNVSSVDLVEITSVTVETNDSGPWGMDVWFIVKGASDNELCTYPMGATNDEKALDYFVTLPGFELKGMNSTENARFVCWQKPG